MSINQIRLIFLAHLRVILITTSVIFLSALLTAALLPKAFNASATLIIDVRSPDSIFGSSGLPLTSPAYMNTQAELVTSGRVIRQAIKSLELTKNEELKSKWSKVDEKDRDFETWLIEFIKTSIDVSPGKESNTLLVTATTESAKLSTILANGIASAYILTSAALNVEPAKTYTQLFEEQKLDARRKLVEAQQKLSDFQRERGIVVVNDDQIDVENARLNELSSALTQVQAESAEQFSRAASSGDVGLLQDPINNTVLNTLRTQLQQKQSMLAEAAARIGENHPEYRRLQAEVNALQISVNQEIVRNNASLSANARASAGQAATLKKAIEEQRNKILKLKENSDSAMTLKRDVEAAIKEFELVSSRTSMSEVSSRQTTANAFLVSEASVPLVPSSPKIILIALSGLLFGLALGASIACVLEFLDQRVRSQEDLRLLGLPMLALIPSNNSTYRHISD
ncbi:GNVR domain-containing protein [Limnobacter sp.]|jgi:chain length determinant protein EpsF|uniref:GNVR domain-containing protein n=1 Tax=Limnobacter sp. TaxID=2003368 RepID=UPI0039BD0A0B